jgi:hypothetical protein
MSELVFVIECSETLLSIPPCCTFHVYLIHNRMSYLLSNPPYQKDERALPGDLHIRKFSSVLPC